MYGLSFVSLNSNEAYTGERVNTGVLKRGSLYLLLINVCFGIIYLSLECQSLSGKLLNSVAIKILHCILAWEQR